MGKYLITEEVAAVLRTSPSTVRYWRATGVGPRATKVGKRVLYEESDLNEWIASQQTREAALA